MTVASARWQRIRLLFDELVVLPQAEQSARLGALEAGDAALRDELASLLAAERTAGDRFEQLPSLPDDWNEEALSRAVTPGSHIGVYRVIREIGRGGMGAVYEGVRDDAGFAKRVAIKMVVSGRDTEQILRRFRYERQILARLEHRNIAALLDGGVTAEGQPYFAMEYVEGERIDRYCDRNKLGVRARLLLMRQVCAAVHYAHQNLVVHRDLKPSNILVAPDGTVKLLDFGIAKLIDPLTDNPELTDTGMLPMTTGYASPEQLRGESVTTATDIYSLGVVLYELVAGGPPFNVSNLPLLEARSRLLEETPTAPSQAASRTRIPEPLPRNVHAELDNLVLMALRKEAKRRYASAEQLSDDLRRLLEGLPILAQPDTHSYRIRKFVSRNRVVVTAVGLLFVTLAGGLALSLRQQRIVQRERTKALAVSRFLQTVLQASSPEVNVGDKGKGQRTITDVLNAASLRLETEDLSREPELKATLQGIIGTSYLAQGKYEAAGRNLRAALAWQTSAYGEGSPELLNTLVSLAGLSLATADYDEADKFYNRQLDILRSEQRKGHIAAEVLMTALNNGAVLRRARGHSDQAEPLLQESIRLGNSEPQALQAKVRFGQSMLTLVQLDQGKFSEAEVSAQRLVDETRQRTGDESAELCSNLTLLGSVLMERGNSAQALLRLREAETLYRRFFDSSYVALYDNVRLQAQVLYALNRLPEADTLIHVALEKYRRFARPQYISFATALTTEGLILNKRGQVAEAERVLREALQLRVTNLPPGHFMLALTQGALGEVLVTQRHFAEAETLLVASYTSLTRSQATRNERVMAAKARLVTLYTSWGRAEKIASIE